MADPGGGATWRARTVYDWSIGSFETGSVELDAPEIVAAVASALLAVGARPPGECAAHGRTVPGGASARADWQRAVTYMWADDAGGTYLVPPGKVNGAAWRSLSRSNRPQP
jgi:hypothetical protein